MTINIQVDALPGRVHLSVSTEREAFAFSMTPEEARKVALCLLSRSKLAEEEVQL